MTLYYRPVNRAVEDTPCPMPYIKSELQDVAGSTVFAKLYFTSGYWLLPLHEEIKYALSFVSPSGIWRSLPTTHSAKQKCSKLSE